MAYELIKYPRTPHLAGSRLQPGDEDLSQIPFSHLAGRHIVVEEKCDGANSAISFGEDGGLLGYAVLSVILDEGNLDNIAVARPARRRGVGDALLSVLTGFGREHLACLMLEVRASNAPAIALYEKHGFAAVGRRKNYYDAPREDAVLMTLTF